MSKCHISVFNLWDDKQKEKAEGLLNRQEVEEIKITREAHAYVKGQAGITESMWTVWWKEIDPDISF